MPPRRRSAPRLPLDSAARYERVPGSARRYLDRVTGETISYHQRDQRLHHGESRTKRAERRTGMRTSEMRRLRKEARRTGGKATFGLTHQRRRGQLAEAWGQARRDAGDTSIPIVKSGKRAGRVNRSWAARQPEFLALELRLAELSREARGKAPGDPFFAPDGEYAQTLVALGRRPAGYAGAGVRVGDSPTGTMRAMQDISALPQSGLSEWLTSKGWVQPALPGMEG